MKDTDKTKEQLIEDLRVLRQRVADLEAAKATHKEAEAKHQTIINTAMDGFWLIDIQGYFLEVNDAYCHLTGYSHDEILTLNIKDIEAAETLEETVLHIQRIKETGADRFETKHRCKDGRIVDVEVSVNYLQVGGGQFFVFIRDITERKRAEEMLADEATRRRILVDQSKDGIVVIDENGKVYEANQRFAEMLGYSPEETRHLHVWDWDTQWTREQLLEMVLNVDEAGEHLETYHRRKDGTIYDVEISTNGAICAGHKLVFCVCRDITERKKAEEALRASETQYRLLAEHMSDVVWMMDLDLNLTWISPSTAKVRGYSLDEIFALPLDRQLTPESLGKAVNLLGKWMHLEKEGRTPDPHGAIPFELEFTCKDGHTVWLECAFQFIRDEQGKATGILAEGRDITERKKVEEDLRKFKTISEAASYGIVIGNTDGIFEYVNQVFAMMHGYSVEELLGKHFSAMHTAEQMKRVEELHNQLLQKGVYTGEEVWHRRKDGTVFPALMNATAIRDDKGNPLYFAVTSIDITERKQVEDELKLRSELLDSATDSIFVHDLEGIFSYVNETACRVHGYSREEFMKLKLQNIVAPERVSGLNSDFQQMLKKGQVVFESAHKRKNGSVMPVEVHGRTIELGGRTLLLTVIRDITERKVAEMELKRSEEKYRTILASIQDSYFEVDLAGNFTFFNDTTWRDLGYSPEELIGMHYQAYIAPEDVDSMYRSFNQAYRTGKAMRTPAFKLITKGGTTKFTESWVSPLRNEAGEIVGFRGLSRDVTERKQAEEALRRSEERYRTVLEQMEEAYYEVDLAGNFTFFNDGVCRQLGSSREELIGINYRVFTPKDDVQRVHKIFNQVYRTGKAITGFPSERIRKDGARIFTENSAFPLRNESGEIIGFRGVVHNITERKQAEEEKRQMEQRAQLASRLASVGELASGVAHEINNPLTGVIGYAHLLLTKKDIPQDIKHDIEVINEGAQRVAGIVRKLLAFARQTKPERRDLDINEIIGTTLELRAYELASNNIKVTQRLAQDLPITIADPGQLQQVFLNLIINAETEMKLAHGGGRLLLKTEQVDNTIRISFKDNGPGIAKKNLVKIFDPFFTTRDVGQGTGLGLSVCHGIMTEHKGKIYAESNLGKGATFIVELPIITKDRQLEMPKPAVEEPQNTTKAKILVVDDELVIRQFVSQVLSEEGHNVEAVDKGEDALERIKGKRYHLILLDIKMPGMSGIELYKQFQMIAPSLAKRVVFITGDVLGKQTTAFLAKTKAPCIMKPFEPKLLKTKIDSILTGNM